MIVKNIQVSFMFRIITGIFVHHAGEREEIDGVETREHALQVRPKKPRESVPDGNIAV